MSSATVEAASEGAATGLVPLLLLDEGGAPLMASAANLVTLAPSSRAVESPSSRN